MRVTEIAVKRPTVIIVIIVLIMLFGGYGYVKLGANMFPAAEVPIISISTTYFGAGAEDVKKVIVKPIEDAISVIDGIKTIRSGAREGYGYTVIEFNMDVKMDTALLDAQKAVDGVLDKLPKDADKPKVEQVDKGTEPVMTLIVSGNVSYDLLKSEANRIKKEFEGIDGVGQITKIGEQPKEVGIIVDENLLGLYKISINTLIGILKSNNINMPAGKVNLDENKNLVRFVGEFENIDQIKNTLIPVGNGDSVKISDFAQVEYKYKDSKNIMRNSGERGIGLLIQKQKKANVIDLAKSIKTEIETLKTSLSSGVSIVVADDTTRFMSSSIFEMKKNILEGILITALVIFIFLRKVKSALIVLIAIPTSLAATFMMMYIMGFTLNLISLMALSICIGILVDDSIVIIENIERHLKMGKSPMEAAIEGRYEIGMAAISITLCDIVVFMPMSFMDGMVGKFFREFGLTVVFATAFSLFVSFTITPMLASRFFKKVTPEDASDEELNISANPQDKPKNFMSIYEKFLRWTLENRLKSLVVIVLMVVLSILPAATGIIGTEFLPQADQSKIEVDITLSPDTPMSATDTVTQNFSEYLKSTYKNEIDTLYSIVGAKDMDNTSRITLKLVDKKKRQKNQASIATEIRTWAQSQAGVQTFVSEPTMIGETSMDGTKPLVIIITGNNLDLLKDYSKKIEEIVKATAGTVDVESSIGVPQKEISAKFDRIASQDYGILASDTAIILRTAIAGTKVGIFREGGTESDIILKIRDDQINGIEKLAMIKVTGQSGQQVDLGKVVELKQTDSPQELLRQNRKDMVLIKSNIQGRVLGDVTKEISKKLESIALPNGYRYEFGGDQKNADESFVSLVTALIASVVLIYFLLILLYESYTTPFIRMLSLPVGIIGALLSLVITGNTLNINSMMGLIMLDALVAKNGTLLIDYANTLMRSGLTVKEALIKSGTTRITPIVMTSAAMIAGMLPAVLAPGDGAEIKVSMGIVLIGGLITSTILSPVLIPISYSLMDDFKKKFLSKKR